MKITFLGAGVFGTALANIARDNGHEIKFYDPYKYPDLTLHDAINGSDLNIYTAPSNAAENIIPDLDQDTPLIVASKGFVSLKPFEKIKHLSALGGAGFANDVNATKTITFTTSSETAETIFSTENIHVEYTNDTLGIMLCGALKNVYAIGAGLYGETEADVAPMSYLETAISEMQQILAVNHANPETLRLSCGAADLVLSCSKNGRNFRFGKAIKTATNTTKPNETVEGLAVINSLDEHSDFIIPDHATLIKDIIKTVKEYYGTK